MSKRVSSESKGQVQVKTTNEILAYVHELKGFMQLTAHGGQNLLDYGNKKWVSFEDYEEERSRYQGLVERLGKHYEWLLHVETQLFNDKNAYVAYVRHAFQEEFAEFFEVTKKET